MDACSSLNTVTFGKQFLKEFKNYPDEDKRKISRFVAHVKKNGLNHLEGVNKSSNDIPKDDPKFASKIALVNKYRLWHYHIGIKCYDLTKEYGKRTSEWVLHYKNELQLNNKIEIVDCDRHPPFKLPTIAYLE